MNFEALVSAIVEKQFAEPPLGIRRMTMGACNEVYSVELSSGSVIVRMNENGRYLKGSEKNIPILRSLGTKVPEILVSDYSMQFVPICYQVQSRLVGTDLGQVISSLSDGQLAAIAQHVVAVFRSLQSVSTNGKYGYFEDDDSGLYDSWSEVMAAMIAEVERRDTKTGVVGGNLLGVARQIFSDCKPYFDSVPSICFYDDISSKNVLVHQGVFSGVVDLDGLAYGDPLEAIGRMKACWFGTRHGQVYLSEVERCLNLTERQRNIVTAYALLHRISWLSEKGIQWNRNTSNTIDSEAVERDRKTIADLYCLVTHQ